MNKTQFSIIIGLILIVLIIAGAMYGLPKYGVYQQGLKGTAELKRAEQNRQIKINEAKADKESSVYRAQADSIRAIGTANANKIIAESITPEYIKWLFVDQIGEIDGQVIYVPTEAQIPLMEAGKRNSLP